MSVNLTLEMHVILPAKKLTFGPLEIPLIEKDIVKFVKLGLAKQIHDEAWLFKPLLAPKSHQENITDIIGFV